MRCLSTYSKAVVFTTQYRLFPPVICCIVVLAYTGNFRHHVILPWKKKGKVVEIKLYDEIATTSQR